MATAASLATTLACIGARGSPARDGPWRWPSAGPGTGPLPGGCSCPPPRTVSTAFPRWGGSPGQPALSRVLNGEGHGRLGDPREIHGSPAAMGLGWVGSNASRRDSGSSVSWKCRSWLRVARMPIVSQMSSTRMDSSLSMRKKAGCPSQTALVSRYRACSQPQTNRLAPDRRQPPSTRRASWRGMRNMLPLVGSDRALPTNSSTPAELGREDGHLRRVRQRQEAGARALVHQPDRPERGVSPGQDADDPTEGLPRGALQQRRVQRGAGDELGPSSGNDVSRSCLAACSASTT